MIETRHAARVLLVDDRHRVLLFRIVSPSGDEFWVTPGGGLDEGEDHRAAAARELAEETGRDDIDLGPEIGRRVHTFPWGERKLRQIERWFLASTTAFDIPIEVVRSLDYEGIVEARWWSLEEMEATSDLLTPRRLAELLPAVLSGELSDNPIDLGI